MLGLIVLTVFLIGNPFSVSGLIGFKRGRRSRLWRDEIGSRLLAGEEGTFDTKPLTRKSERGVLQLINKVNSSVAKEDYNSPIWDVMLYEASTIADLDTEATALISTAILSQTNLDDAIIDYVANQIETPLFLATQIRNLFSDVVSRNRSISSTWALDLMACAIRDRSLPNTVSVLLFNKGFHALVTHRIAHALWLEGRYGLASYFQSLTSRKFGVDIHPACCIGQGCSFSNGCGIVIGETATIGNECCILHGVTLGGTGKDIGDRHPKVGDGVFIGANAAVLGNIEIGACSIINAGSVVTKHVEPFTRVGGVPAKLISRFTAVNYDLKKLSTMNYDGEAEEAEIVDANIAAFRGTGDISNIFANNSKDGDVPLISIDYHGH